MFKQRKRTAEREANRAHKNLLVEIRKPKKVEVMYLHKSMCANHTKSYVHMQGTQSVRTKN